MCVNFGLFGLDLSFYFISLIFLVGFGFFGARYLLDRHQLDIGWSVCALRASSMWVCATEWMCVNAILRWEWKWATMPCKTGRGFVVGLFFLAAPVPVPSKYNQRCDRGTDTNTLYWGFYCELDVRLMAFPIIRASLWYFVVFFPVHSTHA